MKKAGQTRSEFLRRLRRMRRKVSTAVAALLDREFNSRIRLAQLVPLSATDTGNVPSSAPSCARFSQ
jgi:hypothetical protein